MNINTNNNSSSSGYTTAAYSSKGVAGLASGIDTESVVQAMLMNEQNKIDKQTQQQQILEWKQDAYRDVITKINDFQDKYFNLTSDSCIRLASLYNTMSAESSSKAVTVTPSSSAVDGNFSIQVAQLATNTSVTSKKADTTTMSTTDHEKAAGFKFNRNVNISVGGNNAVEVDLKGVNSIEDVVDRINNANTGATASISEGVTVKGANDQAVSYKLLDGDNEYKGNVKVTFDGNHKPTFKKENGDVLNVEYYDSKGQKLDAESVNNLTFSEEKTKELRINAGSSEVEITGSTAGLAILGFSGTVKTTDDNKTLSSKGVNTNLAAEGTVNGKIDFTLDGITKSFDVSESADGTDNMTELMKKVKDAFGDAIKYEVDANGNYSIGVNGKGRQLTISANGDTMEALGFGKDAQSLSTQIRRSDTLASAFNIPAEANEDDYQKLVINDVEIQYKSTDTVSSLMNKINESGAGVKMSYNDLSATFKLETENSGAGFDIKVNNDPNGILAKLGFNVSGDTFTDIKQGKNAIVNIDGTTVERSSNKMNYNGQLIDLNATTGSYKVNSETGELEEDENGNFIVNDGTVEQKAEITSSRDVDKVYNKLKAFVDDYNTLIEDLNKMIHEDANYKKYPPLTEAQKKEMTEKEIKLWEEKSKQGLLRNDRDISSFLSDMRSAMYTKGDSKYILSSIGINSSNQWSDYGKLSIDEDTLKSALKNDADEVAKVFTGEKGLATRLNDICKKTANTSSGTRGTLVTRAGVKGKATEKDNDIYDQLQQIKDKLEKLNKKYESKKERLWKQFNAMETALSKANSQSDYFSNYM